MVGFGRIIVPAARGRWAALRSLGSRRVVEGTGVPIRTGELTEPEAPLAGSVSRDTDMHMHA